MREQSADIYPRSSSARLSTSSKTKRVPLLLHGNPWVELPVLLPLPCAHQNKQSAMHMSCLEDV